MSQTISQLPSTLPNVSASTAAAATPTSAGTLNPTDFIKLMITQLQQQDPLNPTSSNQLLTQMSQISNLQSNQSMVSNLQGLTLQQSIGAGGNLIGKTVQGLTSAGKQVSGTVTSVTIQNQNVLLQLDSGQQIPLASVEQIAPAASATTVATPAAGALGAPISQTMPAQPSIGITTAPATAGA